MARRLNQVLAPGVHSMTPNEKPVRFGILFKHAPRLNGKSFHVLTIFQYWQPLPVFVGRDAFEPLQHFITFDEESSVTDMIVRKDGTPNGVCVKNGARATITNDGHVQKSFGGGPALIGLNRASIRSYFEDVLGEEAALVQ